MLKLKRMRVPGFEPEFQAWQAQVIPGYTTPARMIILKKFKLIGPLAGFIILHINFIIFYYY